MRVAVSATPGGASPVDTRSQRRAAVSQVRSTRQRAMAGASPMMALPFAWIR
ncbi:hypothetical protein SAMN04487971_11446 [Paracoccus chinensis]|uniref:Uncharacterized protein n=1 Tax=Paracoccus chinensis TaxID=525640 RepID=A0A1G9LE08_9RHOB|nr:hypothetical protein SAMN04487971_11446 [Paracoccus chinensis]